MEMHIYLKAKIFCIIMQKALDTPYIMVYNENVIKFA
jgi:hypothetical protein